MAKDGGSTILIFGAVAAAGYVAYKNGLLSSLGISPAAAPVSSPAPTTTTTGASPAVPPPSTPPASTPPAPSHTLVSLFSALKAAVQANAGDPAFSGDSSNPSASCDVFNYYLSSLGQGVTDGMLDCGAVRSSGPMTLSDYWAWAAPQLGQKLGLSGLGSVYAGLAALVRQARGW